MNHGFSRFKVISALKLFIRAFEKRKIVLPAVLNENGTEKLLSRLRFVPNGRLLLGYLPALADIARFELITLMTNGTLPVYWFSWKSSNWLNFIECTLPRISRLRWTFSGRFDIKILRTACSISHEKLIANFMRGNFSSQPDRKPK